MEAVLGGSGGLGGALGGDALPTGANDLAPSAPQATATPDVTSATPSF